MVRGWALNLVLPWSPHPYHNSSPKLSCLLFQWDLVCSSQRLKPMGQSIFMAGILAGAFIWGLLSYR